MKTFSVLYEDSRRSLIAAETLEQKDGNHELRDDAGKLVAVLSGRHVMAIICGSAQKSEYDPIPLAEESKDAA